MLGGRFSGIKLADDHTRLRIRDIRPKEVHHAGRAGHFSGRAKMNKIIRKILSEIGETLRTWKRIIITEFVPAIIAVAVLVVGWFAVVPFVQGWVLPQFGIYPELDEVRRDGTVRMPQIGMEAAWGLELVYVQPLSDGRDGVRVDGDPFHPADTPWMEIWSVAEGVELRDFDTVEQSRHGGLFYYDVGSDEFEEGRLVGVFKLDGKEFHVRCGDQYRRASTLKASGRWCLPLVGALRPLSSSKEDFPVCIDRRMDEMLERLEPRPLPESMICEVAGPKK